MKSTSFLICKKNPQPPNEKERRSILGARWPEAPRARKIERATLNIEQLPEPIKSSWSRQTKAMVSKGRIS
jgi:hypothetical protein